MEYVRDTLYQTIQFWSPNHNRMPAVMSKARSFLEEKRSWLRLDGRAVIHQAKKGELRAARRRKDVRRYEPHGPIHSRHMTSMQLFIERISE